MDAALNWTKPHFRWSWPGQEGWFRGVISARMSGRMTLMLQHNIVAVSAVGSRRQVLHDKPRSACEWREK